MLFLRLLQGWNWRFPAAMPVKPSTPLAGRNLVSQSAALDAAYAPDVGSGMHALIQKLQTGPADARRAVYGVSARRRGAHY